MAINRSDVHSLAELVATAISARSSLSSDSFLWYRGIHCTAHSLLPKLMRDRKTEAEIFERELRLLTRFRQRGLAYWPSGYPQTDWEHLFAMQHFGMPTRLLDWSENLFVAAYFALSYSSSHIHDGPCVPAIWFIDPVGWNRSMPVLSEYGDSISVLTTADENLDCYRPETPKKRLKSPVAIFGSHNSQRIVAQRGTFIVWGADSRPLEDFTKTTGPTLWCIRLMGDRDMLHQELQSLGFGETMMFPELSYLATELARTEGWR